MEIIRVAEQGRGNRVSERYNEEAQFAIHLARQEARRRGAKAATVGDLLSGLSWESGTRADRVGSLKTNALYLRWLVGLPMFPATHPTDPDPQADLDREVRRALAFAQSEADRDGIATIHSDHLLRGLMRFPNAAHFALLKTQVSLHSARTAAKKDREEFFPSDSTRIEVYKYRARRYLAAWAPSLLGIACYLYILMQGIAMTKPSIFR